ncbi:MAG: ATP-binding cassette domain-containing protein [Tumebacillaceae bacterium]
MNRLLTVNGLCKSYREAKGVVVTALQDVSLQIRTGECLGLVGESGSGKSTLAKVLLGLDRPDGGEILLNGVPYLELKGRHLRETRRQVQVVFQDPSAALNQRLTILRSVMEPLDNFPDVHPPFLEDVRNSRRATAARLLEMVGLKEEHLDRYPHELSGGQRQRVAIARGISLSPHLLICDEPTSSLDVSVQAQILQLLKGLQTRLGISYLFISHDIAAVRMMSDRIIVMQAGRIVDQFDSDQLMSEERHPYTRQLVLAVC